MKNYLFLFISMLIAFQLSAQDKTTPFVLEEIYVLGINQTGEDVVAQDISGSALVYNIPSGELFWYGGIYPGNGNCLSNNGILVGEQMESSRAVIMKDNSYFLPTTIPPLLQSAFDCITPDGTRVCGWIQNPRTGVMQIPFYCDIAEDGTVGEPNILPYPSKDFFNEVPQYCTAAFISDDGKTIAGVVQDSSGFYRYPIVYKQKEGGEWEYMLPSEPMFNPEHLEIPKFPNLYDPSIPKKPEITDFMTQEMKEEWYEAMKEYEATGDPQLDPWSYVVYFTGEEGYDNYEKAIIEYNRKVNETIGKLLDEYWLQMAKVGKYARFTPNLALSPQGDVLIIDLGETDDDYTTDISTGYVTYKFDLTKNDYTIIESKYKDLLPSQILNNGTYIGIVSPSEAMGYNTYILLPDATEYISFEEYIANTNPSYLSWFNDTLNLFGEGVISGVISFSEDMSVIAGGVPYGNLMSYIITDAKASVEKIGVANSEVYNVFNFNGVKVMTTKEKSEINKLPKGFYIINGKKIKL